MRFLLLVASLLVCVFAATCTDEEMIGCFTNYMDLDGNGYINVTEVNHFMLYDPCDTKPPIVLGETLIGLCDKTGDGFLSVEDYNHPNSCKNILGFQRGACMICKDCIASSAR